MARVSLALIGLTLLPACGTCRDRAYSPTPFVREPDAVVRSTDTPGWVTGDAAGFGVELALAGNGLESGIVLVWIGDFTGRPPRDQRPTFDSRAPVAFPWRPGIALQVPRDLVTDGWLDVYLLVIEPTGPGTYQVHKDRQEIAVPAPGEKRPWTLAPRPLRYGDLALPRIP